VEMDNPESDAQKIPGIGYHHAYAIMGFDLKTDQVTVWNPWGQHFEPKGPEGAGHGFATEHGIFHIPLATLYQHFSTVHLETTERATTASSTHKPPRHG
jgi:hypothetical protein